MRLIPLRGQVVCNLGAVEVLEVNPLPGVAIPLRGYVICNRDTIGPHALEVAEVAIPLRGYVVCNSRACGPIVSRLQIT